MVGIGTDRDHIGHLANGGHNLLPILKPPPQRLNNNVGIGVDDPIAQFMLKTGHDCHDHIDNNNPQGHTDNRGHGDNGDEGFAPVRPQITRCDFFGESKVAHSAFAWGLP